MSDMENYLASKDVLSIIYGMTVIAVIREGA